MKRLLTILLVFTVFSLGKIEVKAAETATESFKIVTGQNNVEVRPDGYYEDYGSGISLVYLQGKTADNWYRRVYCMEFMVDAPNVGCQYKKTKFYTTDPGILYILSREENTICKNAANNKRCTRKWYFIKKATLYRYLLYAQNNGKKIFSRNENGQTVNYTPVGAGITVKYFTMSNWNPVVSASGGTAATWFAKAKSATANQNKSSITLKENKSSKPTCKDGNKVISQAIDVVGKNIDIENVKYVVTDANGNKINGSSVIKNKTGGNSATINVVVPLSELTSKDKNIVITATASSNDSISKFYIYKENNCSGSVQDVLINDPETVDVTSKITIKMNNNACATSNYSIDAACVGCDDNSKEEDRTSYIIQDSNDWQSILRSTNDDYICEAAKSSKVLKTYYKKSNVSNGCQIFCREEVRLIFPNANDTPTVARGSYFTVHSPFRGEDGKVAPPYDAKWTSDVNILNESLSVSNWGQIKVQKVRECRMDAGGKTENDEKACLVNNTENLMFTENVDVQFTYKGKAQNSEDSDEVKLYEDELTDLSLEAEEAHNPKVANSGEFGSGSQRATSVTKNVYTFEDNDLKSRYIFTDTQTTTYKLPGTTYKYILKEGGVYTSEKPKDGTYTDIGIAAVPVSSKNKVLTEEDATILLNFKLSNDMHLSKSFTKNNDYLPTCSLASQKEDLTNIYTYINKNATLNTKVISGIPLEKKAKELAGSACAKLHMCTVKASGGKWSLECKREGINSCIKNRTKNKIGNADNGTNCFVNSSPDESENKTNYSCAVYVDPIFSPPSDIPEYDPDCPLCKNVVEEPYTLPPTGATDYNVVYRTIDLNNPFPGKEGDSRQTGANWCSKNRITGDTICDGDKDNVTVKNVILNNRGKSGEEVYNTTPMYVVELNKKDIESIQSYNNKHTYSEYGEFYCKGNGTDCEFDFIDKYVTGGTEAK